MAAHEETTSFSSKARTHNNYARPHSAAFIEMKQLTSPTRKLWAVSEIENSTSPLKQKFTTLPTQKSVNSNNSAVSLNSCPKCSTLHESLLAGQLQNESLTRSLSHIVAKLKSATEITTELRRILDKRNNPSPRRTPEPPDPSSPTYHIQIKAENSLSLSPSVVDGMYPASDGYVMSEVAGHVEEVESILRGASELCLTSAGSSFATSVTLGRAYHRSSSVSVRKLERLQTLPSIPAPKDFQTSTNTLSDLGNLIEEPMGSMKRSHSDCSLNSMEYEVYRENHMPRSSVAEPFHSRFLSLLRHQQPMDYCNTDSVVSLNPSLKHQEEQKEFVYPLGMGMGNESKQLLEKIAQMENERLKLLERVDNLQEENTSLWDSLLDVSAELDRKALHLQLALQDLSTATNMISNAALLAKEKEALLREKESLNRRLENLEDEGSAVKESLVQLLTEKSATNRTLTLENQRLRAKIVNLRSASSPANLPAQTSAVKPVLEQQDSFFNGLEDFDILNTEDGGQYVHKQGFLTKQGGKIKSWKKRLFVLDNQKLSYFKTDEALGEIALEEVTKVHVRHKQCIRPHLFEVHTMGGRVYLLSSETHEEMQQWVGMLQTLKHSRERSLKTPQRSMNLSVGDRPVSTLTTTQSSPPSQDPPPGYKAVKHRSHSHFDSVTSMTLKLPRTSLHEDSSRKRVFSAAKTVPYSVNLTATDEEDEGHQSPAQSSDD